MTDSNWVAGWISSAVLAAAVALESSSTQIGTRLPLSASITVMGSFESWDSLRLILLIGIGLVFANACGLSRPGTRRVITCPGLKPSLRLYGAAVMGVPSLFCGMARVVQVDPPAGGGRRP